ncbi:MAG: PEP-CTERM sorting domain-containing protein [Planctomycetota bacterium]|nr:PEP-CTERM sorting domain-containing protein [Planctomycetota bacterium]
MKSLCLAIVLSLVLVGSVSAQTDPIINEFVVDHTGSDQFEFVEILGDPFTDYSDWTVLEIEGQSSSPGTIDDYTPVVGTTNGSGYWVSSFTGNAVENGTLTLLLVKNFVPVAGEGTGDDIDANDDGTIDTTFWDSIADCVGLNDEGAGDHVYCSTVLTDNYDGQPFTPGGASRIPNGTDTDTAGDWRRNDFGDGGVAANTAAGLPGGDLSTLDPSFEALNTPGLVNEIPEPGTLALLSIGALCLLRRRS